MTNIQKITCDTCEAELTYTDNCQDFYLSLNNEAKRPRGNIVTLMYLKPCLDGAKHFCGLMCLKKWMVKIENLPEEKE